MSPLAFAVRGEIRSMSATSRGARRRAATEPSSALRTAVRGIVDRVRAGGDAALRELARELDGVTLDAIEVPRAEWDRAVGSLDAGLRRALERAAANIRAVHEAFRPVARSVVTADSVVVGRRPEPLARAGVYAPGGRASYPSSLLMGAVPARVAGVGEVIVCSPPGADGLPAPVIRAAAAIAGVDRLFAVGGAGAVAAMAYGTVTIPAVDCIVGPGNAFVAEAKLQVAHAVRTDSPAGPSELLVIADDLASPDVVAREMLAQAEHDPDASVVLVARSATFVDAVLERLESLVGGESRATTIRAAFAAHGALLVASSLDEAVAFANDWAAEHLMLAVSADDAARAMAGSRSAGSIFVGEASSVAFGDYLTGANHVLPTGGQARTRSGLSTEDFVRWTGWQQVDPHAAARLAADVELLAVSEGLPAHAAAAGQWRAS
jgi:histidinol dehydrogenase